MAQTTANPGGAYGLGSAQRRGVAAAIAVAAALAFAALVMTGSGESLAREGAGATVSPAATIQQVDDFVTRRYLANPTPVDDSWKDDHITRRYLPGS